MLSSLRKYAKFGEPVLVCGESGTGKELIARALYLLGDSIDNRFVAVNCPQHMGTNMTTSELFGHKKGSFTGAVADRVGMFEFAKDGLVFLDEIADLPIETQVMLLRALAEGEFRRVGETEALEVNTRVVAATNRSLEDLVVKNEFRHDLFFRLSFFRIDVPPLRDREDDWFEISAGFLDVLERTHGMKKAFSPKSIELLRSYHWPGNIRQLYAVVVVGYSSCEGQLIEPEHFERALEWKVSGIVPSADGDANDHSSENVGNPTADNRDSTVDQLSRNAKSDELSALYQALLTGKKGFWEAVHKPFLDRDYNRREVKTIIERGLNESGGSYKTLVKSFGLSECEYQKFMDFLKNHRLKVTRIH
ncbi:UNVERIFIED_CONTAM: hypothetical protein GTU68_017171 [Idotea baltica]|nr:hypothetical protein [Idotea baltica]